MSAAALRSQLANHLPLGDELRRALTIADVWFDSEPSIGSFVTRSLLRDLLQRGWTDEQGVPKPDADVFDRDVRPSLLVMVDAWSGSDTQLQTQTTADLIRDWHGAHLSPIIVLAPIAPPTTP